MTKWRNSFIILGVVVVIFYGLLSLSLLGNDVQTTSPTPDQIERSQDEMYLNKNILIQPLGFKLVESGIDDSAWFKFQTKASITDIFKSEIVDLKLLSKKYSMISHAEIEWWNVEGKTLLGGQISLPNNKIMNVGIDHSNGDASVVYIMWHGM